MTLNAQLLSLAERYLISQERIAAALEGLNETYRRAFERQYPQRKEVRDAVITRVPNEEDRLREAQGGSEARTLADWLSEVEDEEEEGEYIGVREREWLNARTPTPDAAQGREGDHEEE